VGGSTAFGTGLDGDDESFAAHLERFLPGTEVINAGVIGHASGQELVRIVTELVDLEPQLVVALNGVNDAMVSEFESVGSYGGGFNGTTGMLENPLKDLVVFTDPNPLRRLAIGLPRLFFPQITDTLFPWLPPSDHVSPHRAAEIYVRNVVKMQRILSAYDAHFLCAIQPFLVSKYMEYGSLPQRFPIVRSVAASRFEAEGIAFVDLNEESGLSPEMFLDSMHLDSRGYEVLARRVAEVIAQRGLLSGD
jgi:lysophospholipase L1-like esterase